CQTINADPLANSATWGFSWSARPVSFTRTELNPVNCPVRRRALIPNPSPSVLLSCQTRHPPAARNASAGEIWSPVDIPAIQYCDPSGAKEAADTAKPAEAPRITPIARLTAERSVAVFAVHI